MYMITDVFDRDGNVNKHRIETIQEKHSFYGDFIVEPKIGQCAMFQYDGEETMLRTSLIVTIEKEENNITIVTLNSIYKFKKVF